VLDEDSRPLVLGGAKQRALLAVLLLHAGQVVSADRLIDELWGEDPPERARSVLQVYVANLRKVLEPDRPKRTASSLLKTQPPGYLLDLGPDELDLLRLERLAAEGRTALAAMEDRIEAELALGRHAELVPELQALVTAHQLRERLHGQRMLALYRSGRQGEALEAYRRTRETLAEELGIDPSPTQQCLELSDLVGDTRP
jgi:DNA-binding SARP family transcriptional activator